MPVPSEIRKLLGNREPTAHASLSSGLQGPIGETHFVVADGQLFVFERQSLIGDFRQVDLDPAHPPKLESGAFSDVLHVALADGAAHELHVSSFDRDAIKKLLDENARPQVPTHDPEQELKASDDGKLPEATQSEMNESPGPVAGDESVRDESEPAQIARFADDASPGSNQPTPETETSRQPGGRAGYTTPTELDPDETKERDEAAKAAEKHGDKNVYYGRDPGCAGCLIQTIIFFGAIVAMWFAHEHAMLNIGVVEPTDQFEDSPVFVLTKIVAVIAGIYLGGKSASLLDKLFQKLNWTGFVAFVRDRVQVFGPRGKWQLTIDASRPYELFGGAHTDVQMTHDKQGKPMRVSYHVYLRITQDGQTCVLQTTLHRTGFPTEVGGLALQPFDVKDKNPRLLALEKKTFRHVLKRLQDWQ